MIPVTWCCLMLAGGSPMAGVGLEAGANEVAALAPNHVTATLISEQSGVVSGETAWIAVSFKIDKKWHIYWNGRSDTGTPPTIKWTAPDGCMIGEMVWPAPTRHLAPGDELDHIYEGTVLVLAPVSIGKNVKPGTSLTIAADLRWVVCSDMCLVEGGKATLALPVVTAKDNPQPTAAVAAFAATRKRIAQPIPKDATITASVDQGKLIVNSPGATRLTFFPYADCMPTPNLSKDGESKGPALSVRIEPEPDQSKSHVRGIIEVVGKDPKNPAFYVVDVPVPHK